MLRSFPSKRSVRFARAWNADCLAVTGLFSLSFLFSTWSTLCLLLVISRSCLSCVFSSLRFSIHTFTRAWRDFTISSLLEICLKLREFQGESSPMISFVIFHIFESSSLYSFVISFVYFNSSIASLWSLLIVVTSLLVVLRVTLICLFSLVKLQLSMVSNSFCLIRDDIWALLPSLVSASCAFSLSISASRGSTVSITSGRLADVLPVGSSGRTLAEVLPVSSNISSVNWNT